MWPRVILMYALSLPYVLGFMPSGFIDSRHLLLIYISAEVCNFRENMVGAILYSNSVLHCPSFSSCCSPKWGKSFLSLKEISDRFSVSSIRADGNKRERPFHKNSPKGEGLEDNPQSIDGRSSMSPNKEEILALFKRIQTSISKGETINSKKRISNAADSKRSAESILEVLRELPRTRGKGKTLGKKGDRLLSPHKDSMKKEERSEHSSAMSSESIALLSNITRRSSNFTRKSPIPALSRPRDKVEPKSEILPETNGNSDLQSNFEEMKLIQLKEVAKSKGIKGYSKLKKNELVELLIRS